MPSETSAKDYSTDNFAAADKFTLGGIDNNGVLGANTALNLGGAGADQSFMNSLKSGFSDMTPAQSSFYGKILDGLGQGLISMEKAKELKEAADLKYERERPKVQSSIASRVASSPIPTITNIPTIRR